MKKRDENTNVSEKSSDILEKRRKTTSANYTMAMTALVLAFIIIVNLVIGSLSTDIRTIDLTRGDVFTITEDTEKFLETLDKDVTIYMILEDITHRNNDLYRLLEAYIDKNSHIKLEVINPAQNPTFLEDRVYVSEGSIIVEYNNKYRALELSDMIITADDSSTGNTYYFYDMEGQITSAISYVTSEEIPKAYMLDSGTMDKLDSSLLSEIRKQNIDVAYLDLLGTGEIPEDADIIIADQPAEDISDKEYELLMEFMENGGSLLMIEYYNHNDESVMTNVDRLIGHYGISVDYGVVLEQTGSDNRYNNTPYYLKPLVETHEITEDIIENDTNLLVVMGDAIEIGDVPSGVTVDPLLTSTPDAYYKAAKYKKGGENSMSKSDSDPVGLFNYAVAITDDISEELQARFVYIASYSFAETDLYKSVIGSGNSTFVVRCMQWLANQDTTISVPLKSRTYSNLIYTYNAQRGILYTIVIIIPAGVLAYGGFVWFRRRRK